MANLKAKLATVVSKRLSVNFKGDKERLIIGSVPIDVNDIDEARKLLNINIDNFYKEHNDILAWGLIPTYDTPSGDLEPGCLFWADWYPENTYWNNHKGAHLIAVLPNGNHWNIDSRASNCTMKEDRTHRCWCRHGEPPNITIDKKGYTCSAGAGSIMSDSYHGFLRNGEFT